MRQQINLYSPIFRREQKKFSALAMAQAVGAVVLGIALLYGYAQWQLGALRAESRQTDRQLALTRQRLDAMSRQFGTPAAGGEQAQIARLETLVAAKARIQDFLQHGQLSNTRGYSGYFVGLSRHHLPGLWLTHFEITGDGQQMVLEGHSTEAALVPRYLQQLAADPLFAGRGFKVFRITRPPAKEGGRAGSGVDFVIKAQP